MKPEEGLNIVTYEVPPVSVGTEATLLSRDPLVGILHHFEDVLTGKKRFDKFKVWKSYHGVPLFLAEIEGELMVYAVEYADGKPPSASKISVMFAGVRRLGHIEGSQRWNGMNDEVLWTGVVLPRCAQHFT